MSIEQRPHSQSTRDGDSTKFRIPEVPTHAPDYEERVDDLGKDKEGLWSKAWFRRATAVGAAAAALTAGLVMGMKATGGSSEGGPSTGERPVATAPANPGEESPAAYETPPANPEAGIWTAENVPILLDTNGDGKVETYNGVEAATEALKLKAEDYPTPEAYQEAFVDRLNMWVNWGNNKAMDKQYAGYLSLNSNSVLGPEAIADDYVDKAFKAALTSDHEEGVPIQGDHSASNEAWAQDMQALRDNVRTLYEFSTQQVQGGEPYQFAFNVESSKFSQGASTAAPYGGKVELTYDDNFERTGIVEAQEVIGSPYKKKSGSTKWDTTVQEQDGVWYTIGMNYQPIR